MDKICITGGTPLVGEITIGGAKNAALPLMAACLLTDEPLELSNVPFLADITTMANLLVHHGASLTVQSTNESPNGRSLILRADNIQDTTAPYDIVRKMRASIIVLGPLLTRFGKAHISLPGGCAIGSRPIDIHLVALEQMGATITLENGYINASTSGTLHGAEIHLPFPSVGATENIILAATLADGVTILHNAAREPEIADLCHCLVAMGATIEGISSSTVIITGVKKLHHARHHVIPDRIEAGTYATAALMTNGDITLKEIDIPGMHATLQALEQAGAEIIEDSQARTLRVKGTNGVKPFTLTTAPYPAFPTDMQAQMTALAAIADGNSTITETIFENRFMHVPELRRMGAEITAHGSTITITGKPRRADENTSGLHGAEVMATDLRASVSLVLAALVAKGETTIRRVYHIDRGYERIEEKLRACGANITRMRAKHV